MLELIDESLESFLRATVPLSATDIDIAFDAPDREWGAKLTRPTVNLFLWDIRRSATRSRSGLRTETRDGQAVHQPARPIVELRYVVTAWTSDLDDERALLSGLLRSLLAHAAIPREFLSDDLAAMDPPAMILARAGEDHMDVFKAVEGQLKPGLNLVVTSEFDTGVYLPAGPPVGSIGTRLGRIGEPIGPTHRRVAGEIIDAAERGLVGAVVRSSVDAAVVNPAGRFLLRAFEGDEIIVECDPELSTRVPEAGGIRFE